MPSALKELQEIKTQNVLMKTIKKEYEEKGVSQTLDNYIEKLDELEQK